LKKSLLKLFCKYTFFRWATVGLVTFCIDYSIFMIFFDLTNSVVIANFISGIFAISFNYFSHYSWSFQSKSQHTSSGIKYLFNLIAFWSISTILLDFLVNDLGIHARFAKLIQIPLVAPFSFLSLKLFVFNRRR